MLILNEILSDLENKRFSDFSDKVKQSLMDKVASNPKIVDFKKELQRIDSLNQAFKAIQNDYKKDSVSTSDVEVNNQDDTVLDNENPSSDNTENNNETNS